MIKDTKELLLGNRYAPLTSSMGLFEKECSEVANQFVSWQEKLRKRTTYIKKIVVKKINSSLEHTIMELVPLSRAVQTRFIFIPLKNGWTAYFANKFRGTDPAVISYLGGPLKCRSIWLSATPHQIDIHKKLPGRIQMTVYDPDDIGLSNMVRKIRLEYDTGKWDFEQIGTPFSFEDVSRYQMRKKTDRFDLPLLKDYMLYFGNCKPFDSDFYDISKKNNAIFVEFIQKEVNPGEYITLNEARKICYLD